MPKIDTLYCNRQVSKNRMRPIFRALWEAWNIVALSIIFTFDDISASFDISMDGVLFDGNFVEELKNQHKHSH